MRDARFLSTILMAAFGTFMIACESGSERPDARIPMPDADMTDAETFDADTTDAAPPDAALPDAEVFDAAPPDAPPLTYGATLSLMEISLLSPFDGLGQGLRFDLNFSQPGLPPVYVHPGSNPGLGTGCFVYETNLDEYTPNPGVNAGNLTIKSVVPGSNPEEIVPPIIPTCIFQGGRYLCAGTPGTGGTISNGPMAGTKAFTKTGAFTAADGGRYLAIQGAAEPANNGAFPIVGVASADTVIIASPAGVNEALPGTAVYMAIAGAGPIPGLADPGLFADSQPVTIVLDGDTGEVGYEDFERTINIAGDFTMDSASAAIVNNIPVDGTAYTLACDKGDNTVDPPLPNLCGTAMGTIVQIETTDADLTGKQPWDFPGAEHFAMRIQCAQLAQTSITVPAEAMAYIHSNHAAGKITRMRLMFLRANLSGTNQANHKTTIIGGHGVIGFTTPAAP